MSTKAVCCWCQSRLEQFEFPAAKGWPYNTDGVFLAWCCPTEACRQRQLDLALAVNGKILYVPLPSQVLFEVSPAKNVLWGGQAGPGKSHGVRFALYKRSLSVPGHEALLLRENWEQLDKTHIRRMKAELPFLGAKLVDRTAVFSNGSFIDCGHMADVEAVSRYLSTEYGTIAPDEASQYPVESDGTTPLGELSTRARKVYRDVKGAEVRPRFWPVSNPGGPSAAWLADMFIHHLPDFEKYPALKPRLVEGVAKGYREDQWAYIPARLDDNPYQDPEYEETLSVLNQTRYEQLRHGDWTVFAGQFFSEWQPSIHVAEATIA